MEPAAPPPPLDPQAHKDLVEQAVEQAVDGLWSQIWSPCSEDSDTLMQAFARSAEPCRLELQPASAAVHEFAPESSPCSSFSSSSSPIPPAPRTSVSQSDTASTCSSSSQRADQSSLAPE